jgi:molybdenum cofactor guanylyltransferase
MGTDATSDLVEHTAGADPAARRHGTAAIVLTGGRSSRFGRDKTRAELAGRGLLERVLDVVTPLVDDVVVVGPWAPAGVARSSEPEPHLGPLGGLAHGLSEVGADRALVLAGDHPLLRTPLLQLLLDEARDETFDAVVPLGPDGPEPLVACYRASVLPLVRQRLAADDRSMRGLRGLLGAARTRWLEVAEWSAADPEGWSFLDVDSPADLADLADRAARDRASGPARRSDPEG